MIVIPVLHLFGFTMDAMITLRMTCITHALFSLANGLLSHIFHESLLLFEEGIAVNQLSSLKF